MTDTILDDHKKWRDELIYTLRLDDVPGDRIGDILLEVDTHVRETGEDPADAFGPAKAYAKERVAATQHENDKDGFDFNLLLIVFGSSTGAALFANGAISLGVGEDAVLGVPTWLALLVSAVILGVVILRLPFDFVRHPRTGDPLLGDTTRYRGIAAASPLIIGVMLYLLGRLLA